MDKVKILVATDFSSCSQEALTYAVSLAQKLNATIFLTHILEPIDYPVILTVMEWSESDLFKVRQKLDHMAEPFRQKGVPIETHLLQGHVAETIVAEAKKMECNLIVIGTHGRTGMAHFFMGSVAELVLRASPVPVLTVRQHNGKEIQTANQKKEKAAVDSAEQHGIII